MDLPKLLRNSAPKPWISLGSQRSESPLLNRLEAFGDIIFGFTLSQLAIGFKFPHNQAEFNDQLPHLLFFCLVFALLCRIWWTHFSLFQEYFVPRTFDVILNFALLGSVVLFSYPLQFLATGTQINFYVVVGYVFGMGIIYGLLGILFWRGWRERWPELNEAQRQSGWKQTTSYLAVALICLLAVSTSGLSRLSLVFSGFLIWPVIALLRCIIPNKNPPSPLQLGTLGGGNQESN